MLTFLSIIQFVKENRRLFLYLILFICAFFVVKFFKEAWQQQKQAEIELVQVNKKLDIVKNIIEIRKKQNEDNNNRPDDDALINILLKGQL